MTDVAILLLIAGYGVLGYYSGLIRRVIGFAALYVGYVAATQVAPTAANVLLQAIPGWTVSDALIAGYFLVLAIVIVIVEVLAAFSHARLQLATVAFDRPTGAILGLLTAIFGISVALFLLLGASQPAQGSPDGAQIQVGDAVRHSFGAPVLRTVEGPARILFAPAIPAQPGVFFSGQEARLQH